MKPNEKHHDHQCMLNPRQRRFAEAFVGGLSASRAYQAAGYKAEGHAAESAASKLLRRSDVAEFVLTLREEAHAASKMAREELVRYLSEVILTPIGEVDESSPLVQEMTTQTRADQILITSLKMVSKIEAARQLCLICGWHTPQAVSRGVDERLAEIVKVIRAKGAAGAGHCPPGGS